jgi:hypothetical protein
MFRRSVLSSGHSSNCNLVHIQVGPKTGQIQPLDTECVIISENVPNIYRNKSIINTIIMIGNTIKSLKLNIK